LDEVTELINGRIEQYRGLMFGILRTDEGIVERLRKSQNDFMQKMERHIYEEEERRLKSIRKIYVEGKYEGLSGQESRILF